MVFGQIIATSHDLGTQKVAFRRGISLISGKSRLVKYDFIWPDGMSIRKQESPENHRGKSDHSLHDSFL